MSSRKTSGFAHGREEIYLCQVGDTVSCGACCGLYNVADATRQNLCRMLEKRTHAFARVPRKMDAILAFGSRESQRVAARGLPMPEFHHCPFLGLIGRDNSRVGCMLHPEARHNAGVDLRGLSDYGSMTCRMYFCPTHHKVPDDLKKMLQGVIRDWYVFGLIVQEAELLQAFYAQITTRSQAAWPGPESIKDPEIFRLWNNLFELKINWPFAEESRPRANYFFNDPLYPKPWVDYTKTGRSGSAYDVIFRHLHSVFASGAQLRRAEQILDEIFDGLADALTPLSPGP